MNLATRLLETENNEHEMYIFLPCIDFLQLWYAWRQLNMDDSGFCFYV